MGIRGSRLPISTSLRPTVSCSTQALIESPDLADQYGSYMSGRHVFERLADAATGATRSSSDWRRPASARRSSPTTRRWPPCPGGPACDDVIAVPGEQVRQAADSIGQTQLARFFAVVNGWLQSADEPFCLWVHTRGLVFHGMPRSTCGIAMPMRMSRRHPDATTVPCRMLPEDYDPDELLGICQSYAGQVTLVGRVSWASWEEIEATAGRRADAVDGNVGARFPAG